MQTFAPGSKLSSTPYVDLSPAFEEVSSVYVLFSWLYDDFDALPYLRVRGDYGSGKIALPQRKLFRDQDPTEEGGLEIELADEAQMDQGTGIRNDNHGNARSSRSSSPSS